MAVQTTNNKPINPRGNDQSPKGYNRAELYSGKALDFDGANDTLSTDYAPSSNIQTTAYWVKLDSLTTNYALGGFVQGTTNQFGLYYWGGEASKNFGFNTWNADSYGIILPDFVDDWFHVVAEYNFSDFTQSKLFVNGQELSISQTKATTLQRTTASRTFKIDSPSASTQKMNGQINGVKVFEGSLTAAQVADLYNNPEKIVPTGVADSALKLWLPMQEGAGTYCINGVADELVENGEFDNVTGGKPDDFVIVGTETGTNYINASNGQLSIVSDGNYIGVEQYPLTIGKTYNIRIDVDSITGPGELSVYLGSGTDYHISSAGIYTIQITATATDFELKRRAGLGAVTAVINSFSIKEVGGEINGATWTHGIGSPVAQTAVIDWNHQSLGGVSNILIPQGLTAGRDLLGNLFENVRKQGALNLDGNSWAEVHDNASLDFGSGSFTLEAWARVKYVNTGSAYNTIMILGGNASTTGNANITMISSLTIAGIYNNLASGSSTLIEGDWIHIVFSYDQTNATLYINGVQVDQDARTAVDITNDLVKYIGRDSTTTRNYPDQIAQPRIYNRALTAEEVQRNYDAGKNIYS